MIETAAIVCIALAMAVPQSLRVAGQTPFDLAVYATIAAYYARSAFAVRAAKRRIDSLHVALLVLLLSNIAAYLTTVDDFRAQEAFLFFSSEQDWTGMDITGLFIRVAVWGVARLILVIAALDLGRALGRSRRRTHAAITILLAAGSLNAAISLYGWYSETHGLLARYNFVPLIEQSQGAHVDRMLLTFAVAFGIWIRGWKAGTAYRFRLLMTMFLAFASIATVFVRQGWALLILITLLISFMSWSSIPLPLKARAFFLAALLFAGASYVLVTRASDVREMFANLRPSDSSDVANRAILIRQAFSVFREHPWIGVGYGEYFAYSTVPLFVTNTDIYVASAHNGALMVLAEMGVVGTICFVVIAVGVLRVARRARVRSSSPLTRGATTAVLAVLMAYVLVHFIADSALLPIPQERVAGENAFLLWLLIGLSTGIQEASVAREPDSVRPRSMAWFGRRRPLGAPARIATAEALQARSCR